MMSFVKRVAAAAIVVSWAVLSAVVAAPPAGAAPDPPLAIIRNSGGGCLDANAFRALYTSSCSGGPNTHERWHPSQSSFAGYIAIMNVDYRLCVDSNRDLAYTNPCGASSNHYQLYRRSYAADGRRFELQSMATGLCLQAYPNRRILLQPCSASTPQLWEIASLVIGP